jgi:MoxR-like ATPase
LLQVFTRPKPPVLLIDELDRADEPFEAFLLEVLSEYQITVPEFGTIKAAQPPVVIITSNRTREIRDALKRRCLYHWVEFPDARRELDIVRRRAPTASETLSKQVVEFVQRIRQVDLFKRPGVAETIDWVNALSTLNVLSLDPDAVRDTLGVLLKYQEDVGKVLDGEAARILEELRAAKLAQ